MIPKNTETYIVKQNENRTVCVEFMADNTIGGKGIEFTLDVKYNHSHSYLWLESAKILFKPRLTLFTRTVSNSKDPEPCMCFVSIYLAR